MVTFTTILSILIITTIIIAMVVFATGLSMFVALGDLLVFGLILWLIVRLIRRRK